MNPALDRLHPYPFERLRVLLDGIEPALSPINMGIGEPQHPTPQIIRDALVANFSGLGKYPATGGTTEFRSAVASWIERRYGANIDPETQVLPVSGTREALFSFGQAVLDQSKKPVVLMPNPFYQIYEGSAILNGAEPFYVPTPKSNGYLPDWSAVPANTWPRVQLAFVCSPGNPTGAVMREREWNSIFEMADKFGFIIAADECYSEIYNGEPPPGALEIAKRLGRGQDNLITFNSLSKRSSAPGLRSGFVAGDPEIIQKLLLYRSYHGAAPSAMVQAASAAAWNDEEHVVENRAKYRAKFEMAADVLSLNDYPEGGFFLWLEVGEDVKFVQHLYSETGVIAVPGSYLARDGVSGNPGKNHLRIALVPEIDVCQEALQRLALQLK